MRLANWQQLAAVDRIGSFVVSDAFRCKDHPKEHTGHPSKPICLFILNIQLLPAIPSATCRNALRGKSTEHTLLN